MSYRSHTCPTGGLTSFLGLAVAILCILIRTPFRIAELAEPYQLIFKNDQKTFIFLEPFMMAIACLCLKILHPGPVIRMAKRASNARVTQLNIMLVPDVKGAFG